MVRYARRCEISGFGSFNAEKEHKVLYLDVKAPEAMLRFRNELARRLNRKIPDLKRKFSIRRNPDFHATIAFKSIDKKFDRIRTYVDRFAPSFSQLFRRVTIIRGNRIYKEVDLATKCVLGRSQALGKRKLSILERIKGLFRRL